MKNENKQMKRGITLIEITLAIVLIAIILGLTIPKLMSNSSKAEIKSTITSDVKAIAEACVMWRKQSTNANGAFQNLSTAQINATLPRSMQTDITTGIIFSSGLRTGAKAGNDGLENATGAYDGSGVFYTVMWQFDPTKTDTGRFSIGMSIKPGTDTLDWDGKQQAYAQEAFIDAVAELSDDQNDRYNTRVQTKGTSAIDFDCANDQVVCLGNIMVN